MTPDASARPIASPIRSTRERTSGVIAYGGFPVMASHGPACAPRRRARTPRARREPFGDGKNPGAASCSGDGMAEFAG